MYEQPQTSGGAIQGERERDGGALNGLFKPFFFTAVLVLSPSGH